MWITCSRARTLPRHGIPMDSPTNHIQTLVNSPLVVFNSLSYLYSASFPLPLTTITNEVLFTNKMY